MAHVLCSSEADEIAPGIEALAPIGAADAFAPHEDEMGPEVLRHADDLTPEIEPRRIGRLEGQHQRAHGVKHIEWERLAGERAVEPAFLHIARSLAVGRAPLLGEYVIEMLALPAGVPG